MHHNLSKLQGQTDEVTRCSLEGCAARRQHPILTPKSQFVVLLACHFLHDFRVAPRTQVMASLCPSQPQPSATSCQYKSHNKQTYILELYSKGFDSDHQAGSDLGVESLQVKAYCLKAWNKTGWTTQLCGGCILASGAETARALTARAQSMRTLCCFLPNPSAAVNCARR